MPKMNLNDYPQEVVLLEDRYPATLKEVTEYEKDYGEGPVPKLAWVFEVTADKEAVDPDIAYEGEPPVNGGVYEIAAHTSFATGPNSNFAKLNFPAFVGEDWDGDTDTLIGKKCMVDVTSYETKGGQIRNVIEKVRMPKAKPEKAKSSAGKGGGSSASPKAEGSAEVDESDFQDIPF